MRSAECGAKSVLGSLGTRIGILARNIPILESYSRVLYSPGLLLPGLKCRMVLFMSLVE